MELLDHFFLDFRDSRQSGEEIHPEIFIEFQFNNSLFKKVYKRVYKFSIAPHFSWRVRLKDNRRNDFDGDFRTDSPREKSVRKSYRLSGDGATATEIISPEDEISVNLPY